MASESKFPAGFPLTAAIHEAGSITVYELFREQALRRGAKTALEWNGGTRRYAELLHRVDRLATVLRQRGIVYGDRVAMLSENRVEYIELILAAARIGAIVACQNWRLTATELQHCVDLVEPALLVHSPAQLRPAEALDRPAIPRLQLGDDYERALAQAAPDTADTRIDPESGIYILYTSGTTGKAKAALLGHRALLARMTILRFDIGIDDNDAYYAWAPMFHMGGTEHSITTLLIGGSVIVGEGFDAAEMAGVIARHRLGWLMLVPAMIERLVAELERNPVDPMGIKAIGAMPDMLPVAVIERVMQLLRGPFFNTFGATETGFPPLSGDLIPPGPVSGGFGKKQSFLCSLRLADAEGRDVADGEPGEAWVRGPTLFSGYWGAPEINAKEFRDGWFRMGDMFRRTSDGRYEFSGRAKYLIKSGGENIYPAEIEQVLLAEPRVSDAVVVRRPDPKWGEIPVAVVATSDATLSAEELLDLCRERLAGYKQPKQVHFLPYDELPRSSSGKVIREEVERMIEARFPR